MEITTFSSSLCLREVSEAIRDIHSSEYVQEHCFSNFSTEVPIMAEETKYGDLVKYG